ncbi:MAG: Eco57I restriction-modification methylase domain-containing protein [Evtepia sp.]
MSTHIQISNTNRAFFQSYKMKHDTLNASQQKQLWQHLIECFLPPLKNCNHDADASALCAGYHLTLNEGDSDALTPEIFGIIFENLMENKTANAAFYTPRAIACLMCRHSLIHYLLQKTNFSKEDLSAFICSDYISAAISKDSTVLDDALSSFSMLDPAVGAGAFVLVMFHELVKARQKVSPLSPFSLKLDIIQNSIFAIDIDPIAIAITELRLRLALSAERETAFDSLDAHTFCGDFLLSEFPDFLQKKDGFDLVIGNPPYLDSETMTRTGMSGLRCEISQQYHFAKGNWDLYIPFFEKGFSLLSTCGSLCYLTPDKWLSKPFGEILRRTLFPHLDTLISAGRDVFETVRVDSMISHISKTKTDNIAVFKLIKEEMISLGSFEKSKLPHSFTPDLLFSDAIRLIQKLEHENQTLGDFYTCENACSTADCYRLKEIIFSLNSPDDFSPNRHFKIINTGTIGSFDSKWGLRPMKYLGDSYLYPVVEKDLFFQGFKNSYAQKSKKTKLILKGLSTPTATIDANAEFIPGKTTLMIAARDSDELMFLAALLNSQFARFFLLQKYAFSSYNGGITFTKAMIHTLPFRAFSKREIQAVLSTVRALQQSHSADYAKLNRQICHLYGLSPHDLTTFNLH